MTDEKGHLKVFIGMAPGVGKTYRMLQEGVAEADSGRDVVVGYLETHGRAETLAQAEGLEIIPRRHRALPRHAARGDGPAGGAGARARAVPDRRARARERTRPRAREALRGRARRARRGDRRVLDGQRPAPGEPQRPGRRADRGARARDDPGRRAVRRGRGGADRPDPRGADRAPARRQGVPAAARASGA